ncbi:MAG: ParB N-terminal domain-containing protein [Intrasporangiaceae bacterium]|nr:ParB N-terminal domain-containing protein [Intrasporangiaceae bacterium]
MTDVSRFQLLPALSSDEYETLKSDIAANGQRDPIVVRAGVGDIVDGHHRMQVCRELEIDPKVETVEFESDLAAEAYALRVNTSRRQLSSHQLAEVRNRQKDVYFGLRAQEGWTQQQSATTVGVPAGTAAWWESEAKKAAEPAPSSTTNLGAKNGGSDDEEEPDETPPAAPFDNRVKLTDEQKDHIYLLATKHGRSQQSIAADYKVSQQAISNVIKQRTKQHEKEQHKRDLEDAAERADVHTDPADITIEPGTWIDLGPHRLYCGDSTSQDFIDATNGAAFAFADPPYNADAAEWDSGFIWDHDYLIDVAPIVAVTPGIAAIPDFMRRTDMPYVWSMAAHISNGMTRSAVGFGNWIYVALFATESVHRQAQDHHTVTVGNHPGSEGHKGRKPPKLLAWLIDLYTEPEDLIVDPFAGSGTTLLVAEQLGRRCVTAEIDPDYCAQIVAAYGKAVTDEAA